MSTVIDTDERVIRIDITDDSDYAQSIAHPNISGINGSMVRVKTIMDSSKKKVTSYFFDHRNIKWVIISQQWPEDKEFVNFPTSQSANSAWRKYKAHSRYLSGDLDVSRNVTFVPRPGIYNRWQRIC